METSVLIRGQVKAALWECCSPTFATSAMVRFDMEGVVSSLVEDAHAFAVKDPASCGDAAAIVRGYTSFRAVVHYRLARAILDHVPRATQACKEADTYAALISSRGKWLSGAELHPHARIGQRFVLDHGVGTVIGETAQIGDDAYLLGGVTLGARGIAFNTTGKRHPTLGHRVQIGAFARIFGPIHIGDDVFVGTHCVLTDDVAAGSIVTLKSTQQITRRRPPSPQGPGSERTLSTAELECL